MVDFKSHIATFLAVPIIYLSGSPQQGFLPQKRYQLPVEGFIKYSWDRYARDVTGYSVLDQQDLLSQTLVLHQVVSSLATLSTDLDPNIARAVDEDFWKLV